MTNDLEDYRLDCLARELLRMSREDKLKWAARQTPAFKAQMRQRMKRILEEERAREGTGH